MVSKINLKEYIKQVKENMKLNVKEGLIKKDLILTLILAEFEKHKGIFNDLIFKGGTLLSRNYLKYHRFSEDLDFVHKDSNKLRDLSRRQREKQIKKFIDLFTPKLKQITDELGLDFSINRSNQKYCSILHARSVYTFRIYYSKTQHIKIEINFIEKSINPPKEASIKAITDFFDSKELMFILGLEIKNFTVLSYSLKEIILEKYRAILTRPKLKERDLFDLFLIKDSLDINLPDIVEKIKSSSLIKRNLKTLIKEKFK